MTIDTSQMFFKAGRRSYAIIDAPGHKEFMKNMVTGASLADAAILIIDISEGLMEQTKRHAFVLNMLGLTQIVVAVNKMDKAGYSEAKFDALKAETAFFLAKLGLSRDISSQFPHQTGTMLSSGRTRRAGTPGQRLLKHSLGSSPGHRSRRSRCAFPFKTFMRLKGRKSRSGGWKVGHWKKTAKRLLYLNKTSLKISFPKENSQQNSQQRDRVEAGSNAGIIDTAGLKRGDIIAAGAMPLSNNRIVGMVFWLGIQPLKKGEKISLRIATQETDAVVKTISRRMDSSTLEIIEEDADRLEATEVGEVKLLATNPMILTGL